MALIEKQLKACAWCCPPKPPCKTKHRPFICNTAQHNIHSHQSWDDSAMVAAEVGWCDPPSRGGAVAQGGPTHPSALPFRPHFVAGSHLEPEHGVLIQLLRRKGQPLNETNSPRAVFLEELGAGAEGRPRLWRERRGGCSSRARSAASCGRTATAGCGRGRTAPSPRS